MSIASSWARIVGWLATNHPATVPLINPPATTVDLRSLQAAMNRSLPADLVEYLEIANGTNHYAIQGSLIPTLYNFVAVQEMLSTRQMLREIQRSMYGTGPWPEDSEPAGQPTGLSWLDSFLPIAQAADAGSLYVDLRDGDQFGCVWEWYPESGGQAAPYWSSVDEKLADIASALVDGRPARQAYASGAVWPQSRVGPVLAEVDDDGDLHWSEAD